MVCVNTGPVLAPVWCVDRICGSALMKLNIEIRIQWVFSFYPVWYKSWNWFDRTWPD